MIYPALSFRYNVPMLFCVFPANEVRNENTRDKLLEKTDLWRHINSQNVKQFIVYGTMDGMVGMDETKNYIAHAKGNGCDIMSVEAAGQDHGVQQKYYMDDYLAWIKNIFAEVDRS